MNSLHALATAAGLQIDWKDAGGKAQRASDTSLIAILNALDLTADSQAAIADSRCRLAEQMADPQFASGDVGEGVPLGCAAGRAELVFEDGHRQFVTLKRDRGGAILPPIDRPGYHTLIVGAQTIRLAIAPPRCFTIDDATQGRRIWGPSVQIAALREGSDGGFGDFGTLTKAAQAFAERGADAVAISPVHALFPADASRYSPYAPSSRRFLNILYADTADLGVLERGAGGDVTDLINWKEAAPRRIQLLRRAFGNLPSGQIEQIEQFRRQGSEDLEHHARFDAIHTWFFGQNGAKGWQQWPTAFHDPGSEAVKRFAMEHADDIRFFVFAQWLAARSLAAANRSARTGGMAVGLIADLAVGLDAGGSHAWSRPADLLQGLSIGAPPDLLGPDGQEWGITGFSPRSLVANGFEPLIATLRSALGLARGIRIDHALGLQRLWVVPHGASATQGAYLTMPTEHMMRVIAIESDRAKAIVVGEDLGTVPPGFRGKMDERGMLGMRVLWFERGDKGAFTSPRCWSRNAAAMTGTHDLPTVAGWWSERDIDWTWRLGRKSPAADETDDRKRRAVDREKLWQSFKQAEVVDGQPQPAADQTKVVVDAALSAVSATPCALVIIPMEDLLGSVEQPNLPGTIDEHPNWRRRMPDTTDALLKKPSISARVDLLSKARPR